VWRLLGRNSPRVTNVEMKNHSRRKQESKTSEKIFVGDKRVKEDAWGQTKVSSSEIQLGSKHTMSRFPVFNVLFGKDSAGEAEEKPQVFDGEKNRNGKAFSRPKNNERNAGCTDKETNGRHFDRLEGIWGLHGQNKKGSFWCEDRGGKALRIREENDPVAL